MKKRYLIVCLMLLICFAARSASIPESGAPTVIRNVAQQVSGRVTDENGQGFPGVNIIVKGTSVGTVSDPDGKYQLDVPDGSNTLVFSFVGYAQQEITIDGRTVIDVQMATDINSLDEVVVTAL